MKRPRYSYFSKILSIYGFIAGEKSASSEYAFIAEDNYTQGYLQGYEDCLRGYTDFYEELQ